MQAEIAVVLITDGEDITEGTIDWGRHEIPPVSWALDLQTNHRLVASPEINYLGIDTRTRKAIG
ncbi:hypothetical protein GCM10022394_01790 [Zobellella aerophila]|uniref:Uncharacterized protein n=1 Tax=Zobellella aerophila TaxID=870480 RepID=A0ABP6V3X0_9GAMM